MVVGHPSQAVVVDSAFLQTLDCVVVHSSFLEVPSDAAAAEVAVVDSVWEAAVDDTEDTVREEVVALVGPRSCNVPLAAYFQVAGRILDMETLAGSCPAVGTVAVVMELPVGTGTASLVLRSVPFYNPLAATCAEVVLGNCPVPDALAVVVVVVDLH